MANPFGWAGKSLDISSKAAERTDVLIREIHASSLKMLKDHHKWETAEKEVSEGIKRHIKAKVEAGEKGEAQAFHEVIEDIRHLGVPQVVLFHRVFHEILDGMQTNKELLKQLPDLREWYEEFEKDLRDIAQLANSLGDRLKSIASSG